MAEDLSQSLNNKKRSRCIIDLTEDDDVDFIPLETVLNNSVCDHLINHNTINRAVDQSNNICNNRFNIIQKDPDGNIESELTNVVENCPIVQHNNNNKVNIVGARIEISDRTMTKSLTNDDLIDLTSDTEDSQREKNNTKIKRLKINSNSNEKNFDDDDFRHNNLSENSIINSCKETNLSKYTDNNDNDNEKLDTISPIENDLFVHDDVKKNLDSYQFNLLDLCSLRHLFEEFCCDLCHQSFRYKVGLISHLSTVHNINYNNVDITLSPVKEVSKSEYSEPSSVKSNTKTLKTAKKFKHMINPLQKNIRKYFKPVIMEKGQLLYECKKCSHTFECLKQTSVHIYECAKQLVFVCELCSMKCLTECGFRKHVFRTHDITSFVICKKCSKMFANHKLLKLHEKEHIEKDNSNNDDDTASE